jgi:glycerol-3-phosphate acyltransferase PlsY
VLHEGSGNPGASNVYRTAGRRAGSIVFAGDLLKGVVASLIGAALVRHGAALGGPAAVVGHCFPVTRRFKGGKGVATAAGFGFVVAPLVALAMAPLWGLVILVGRRASVASLAVAVAFPTAIAVTRGRTEVTVAVVAVAVLILIRHTGNIARLVRGQERTI